MIRELCCAAAMVPALFGACGEDASVGEGAGESAPPPPTQAPQVITDEASGSTVRLPVGGETTLRLSNEYAWGEPVVRDEVVTLARVDYLQDPGFYEWVIMAVAPGKTTIVTAGEPACSGQEGCDDTPARFELTISVTS